MNHRTKALRQLTDDLIFGGVTPLEVMLTQMRAFVSEADKVKAELAHHLSLSEPRRAKDVKKFKEDREAIRTRLSMLQEGAMDRAVQAAPYVHPKLASVAVSSDDKKPARVLDPHVTIEVKQQVFLDQIRDLRKGLPALVEYDEKPTKLVPAEST